MASMEIDETLQLFLEEARDHLRDIETDLLGVETETGPTDVERVNKVFRGIHSIKGASGFFGLGKIKELSHVMENLLNRIRNREILPSRRVVESLLRSADLLSSMVDSPHTSETVDIEASIRLIKDSQTVEPSAVEPVEISDGAGLARFQIPKGELDTARRGGKLLYVLEFDMVADVDAKGMNPLDLIRELEKTGLIVESALGFGRDGVLLGSSTSLPFHMLYATVLDTEMTSLLTGLPASRIHLVDGLPERGPVAKTPVPVEKPQKARKKEKLRNAEAAPPPAPPPPTPMESGMDNVSSGTGSSESRVDESRIPPALPATTAAPAQQSSTLRVNVKVLDRLMTLAGELVLSRNQLVQKVMGKSIPEIQASSQSISLIISELQEAVMSTRMQPLSIVFGKFQRVVRDMSSGLGKEIHLEIEGEDVELDKTVIESIGDPLTHLVRNAVDHGIEATPEERERSGKSRQAMVNLRAYHEAGKVVIEVSDDGRGIDAERVRQKALELKILEPSVLAQMSEKELVGLIFLPGFSTAAKVTDISGRGVGMDVVKTNFTRLGGVIDIETHKGRGTTIRVKLPLTLAIIPSLLVSVQDEIYAIPQVNLVELVRIQAKDVRNRIEKIGDALVMRLRGHLLPLVKLSDAMGIDDKFFQHPETGDWQPDNRGQIEDRRGPVEKETAAERSRRRGSDRRYRSASAVNIAVLSVGSFQYGLIIDRLHESEEIVVKPLGRHFSKTTHYAGATILGDGRVALILDVVGLSKSLNLHEVGVSEKTQEERANLASKLRDTQSLLLFKVATNEQFAIPVALVSRLEVIEAKSIEVVGGRRTVQYRGGSLPLVDLADVARIQPLPAQDTYFVVVFAAAGREVGLIISQIVDITEASEDFDELTFRQTGIIGSAILGGATTLLVDLWGVVRENLPGWIPDKPQGGGKPTKLLVVEDSPFYLRQISGFLEDAGYQVVQAIHGADALSKLQIEPEIQLVLTDIEMPVMDGLELTRSIRSDKAIAHLPVVAVTSLSGEEASRRGKDAGVDSYMVKLDREKILHVVETYLTHGRK